MKMTIAWFALLAVIAVLPTSFPSPAVDISTVRHTLGEVPPSPADQMVCKRAKAKANDGQYAGLIKNVGSRCYRQIGDGPQQLLDPKRDRVAKVNVGERFQCFDGSIMFEMNGSAGGQGATYTIRPADGCHTIKEPSTPRNDASQAGVKSHGTSRAGLTRGDSGPFCGPANKSWVVASQVEIRWLPAAVGSVLSVGVFGDSGVLWYRDGVQGTLGELINDEVRSKLQTYRDKGGSNPVTLIIEDSKGQKYSIEFSLLSKVEEDSLAKDLDNCTTVKDDIMLALCRVAAFRDRRMYGEVTREYDKALQLAPESEELIARTAEAYEAVGDAACRRR
ncbi:MAG TPA: hypothetical protein VGO56_09620 [Pyrinomonadaceae bacterium]|jgi:hypothetical protein|nr:hypothetical protein [Pyrinomonadaceae bacterium]